MNAAVQGELDRARLAFDLGNLSGLVDALIISEKEHLPVARWARNALEEILTGELLEQLDLVRDETPPDDLQDSIASEVLPWIAAQSRGRGRTARWVTRWKQDLSDYHFWDRVRSGVDHASRYENPDLFARTRWDFEDGWGVFEEVAKMESDSGRHVAPTTVRGAYLRVQRRMKTEPHRYYLGRWARSAYRRLGLEP